MRVVLAWAFRLGLVQKEIFGLRFVFWDIFVRISFLLFIIKLVLALIRSTDRTIIKFIRKIIIIKYTILNDEKLL